MNPVVLGEEETRTIKYLNKSHEVYMHVYSVQTSTLKTSLRSTTTKSCCLLARNTLPDRPLLFFSSIIDLPATRSLSWKPWNTSNNHLVTSPMSLAASTKKANPLKLMLGL